MTKKYVVKFVGLSNGEHGFEYSIGKKFFEESDCEDILDADLFLKLVLYKEDRQMRFVFDFTGSIKVLCDRCLEPMSVPMNFSRELYVKFGHEYEEQSEEMIVLPWKEHSIDLTGIIYDYILLAKPVRCVHGEVGGRTQVCNQEMMDILSQTEMMDGGGEDDPRWDELRKLNY